MRWQLRNQRADRVTWFQAQLIQGKGEERRGGRFAVHARHAKAVLPILQGSEQNRPAHDWDPQFFRGLQLGVIPPNGGSVDDQCRTGRMKLFRRMSWMDFRSARPQLPGFLIHDQIRSNHTMAKIDQQMAKPAHATTPSSHEVHNGPGILQDSIHVFCRRNVHGYFEFQVSIVGRADIMHGCDF